MILVQQEKLEDEVLTSAERHDSGPQVARMERYVDTGKRDGGETALELDVALELLLLLGPFVGAIDDIPQHLLDLLDGELLGQLKKKKSVSDTEEN